MKIVLDVEANGLEPTKIWVIHAQDIETNNEYTFYPFREGPKPFLRFAKGVSYWIGHRIIQYDLPSLHSCLDMAVPDIDNVCDTLVLSRMINGLRPSHSLESYGEQFGISKVLVPVKSWESWNDIFIPRVETDVSINRRLYDSFIPYLNSPRWIGPILLEHKTEQLCHELHVNGFAFDSDGATSLATEISTELEGLTKELQTVYQPRSKLIREVIPKGKADGEISRVGLNFPGAGGLSDYTIGASFSRIEFEPFNPASPKQRALRLHESGWRPTDKTEGHKDYLKSGVRTKERDVYFSIYGYKTSEENLSTLPKEAPTSAHSLVKWMLLNSRVNKIREEWLTNVKPDGRIHGDFNGIGAWSQRGSHSNPNMGNIPSYNAKVPSETPYSDRMRALFGCDPGNYLIGVDAESIQLRILAHYANSETFTRSLISGSKKDGTDPHSLNQKALGVVCTSRDAAKTFIYAWVLDAGIARVAEILGCNRGEATTAVKTFLERMPELKKLKEKEVIEDAACGYFEGIDGRYVRIPGEDQETRQHFCMAGWLQNGEKIVMARAAQIFLPKLKREKIPFKIVNWVHDEFQTETPRDYDLALYVAQTQADAIREAGEFYSLRCPMAGSILNSHDKVAIGDNWMFTH